MECALLPFRSNSTHRDLVITSRRVYYSVLRFERLCVLRSDGLFLIGTSSISHHLAAFMHFNAKWLSGSMNNSVDDKPELCELLQSIDLEFATMGCRVSLLSSSHFALTPHSH